VILVPPPEAEPWGAGARISQNTLRAERAIVASFASERVKVAPVVRFGKTIDGAHPDASGRIVWRNNLGATCPR